MAKFQIVETIHSEKVRTVRLADGTNTASVANMYTDVEVGKPVKLSADSRYVLAGVGDAIEGVISTVNLGRYDDFTIGGIVSTGYKEVTCDGLQGTPGTGTIAVGDYVLASTLVPKLTALTGPMKVVKATTQATAMTAPFKARVVSLGTAGTGAVGTTAVVELF